MGKEYTADQFEMHAAFQRWCIKEEAHGNSFANASDEEVVCERAKRYGAPAAISAFHRAFKELLEEKRIKPRRIEQPIEVPRAFRLRVAAMSASDVRIAYQRDPEFRKMWDQMSVEDEKGTVRQVAEVDEPVELSAIQYRSMDPTVLARLLQAPGMQGQRWREAVNKLIMAGSI